MSDIKNHHNELGFRLVEMKLTHNAVFSYVHLRGLVDIKCLEDLHHEIKDASTALPQTAG